MKKALKIILLLIILIAVVYLCLPHYARQALRYLYPDIYDLERFEHHTVHTPDSCLPWPQTTDYNLYRLSTAEAAYLDSMETTAFLVFQHDSIVFENYRNDGCDTLTSNIFSATKSIVSLLTGIACEEGYIKSIDDPVSKYLPAFSEGRRSEITLRHLLTMSASLSWDESYSSLFSMTTQGYYGNNLYRLVTELDVTGRPGYQYTYRSGETQVLAFALEAATGKTLSDYAEEKLWRPLQAEHDAYWLLDRKGGDEKAFCCFHTTARDVARLGHLMLHEGQWHGQQIVPASYMREATTPASYLRNQWDNGALNYYGLQFWIVEIDGKSYPYMRGMDGQYIVAIPEQKALFVRLGHKSTDVYVGPHQADLFRYFALASEILDARME